MKPIPETAEAVRELSSWGSDHGLLDGLVALADRAQAVVPDLIGVSLARVDEGLTFTVVASTEVVAVMDAVQYLGGGPCVDGAIAGAVRTFQLGDPLDEEQWRLFADASAADAVRSTLTLPIALRDSADSTGSVNLYAASGRAFDGHHEQLAGIFGAWAGGAVTNADLSFTTRDRAREAPRRIREITTVNEAVGVLAGRFALNVDAAEQRLLEAADRAGVTVLALARFLMQAHVETLRADDADDSHDNE